MKTTAGLFIGTAIMTAPTSASAEKILPTPP